MKNTANVITIIRIVLATIAMFLLKTTLSLQITAIVLIPIAMILDMVDGMVARKTKTSSINGSVYDILADRIIEFTFFIFFASNGVCSILAALIIIWRGLVLDAIRSIALHHGKTAFGVSSLHESRWAKRLAESRLSRGTYNTLKTIAFMAMALQMIRPHFNTAVQSLVWITVFWSLIRAIPVLFDGYYLISRS